MKSAGPIGPLTELLRPDPASDRPVYLQLSDRLIGLIREGRLRPGDTLPASRKLATALHLNRKTVVAGYDDAREQGYLTARTGAGVRVAESLPVESQRIHIPVVSGTAGFPFYARPDFPPRAPSDWLNITDGSPDVRLTDLTFLHAEMRRLSQRNTGKHLLRYGSAYGDERLREELAAYLRHSRGLAVEADGLLITRGSQQAFHLAARLLLRQGGLFAVAVLHYGDFSAVARECGGEILLLPQDERGLDVEYLRDHPRITELRAVYITPHHQYPTTVTLSAERRLLLLQLAATYQFAVLEDDYDYDFQYAGPAQLPLAALDRDRTVLYLGSFSKVIAPNVRVGYLCGPPDFIRSAASLRRLTDRQGDLLLEHALARYLAEGELQRHLRRVLPVYRARRDRLAGGLEVPPPSGGMALWAPATGERGFAALEAGARERRIWLGAAREWYTSAAHLRLGFAALDDEELDRVIELIRWWQGMNG